MSRADIRKLIKTIESKNTHFPSIPPDFMETKTSKCANESGRLQDHSGSRCAGRTSFCLTNRWERVDQIDKSPTICRDWTAGWGWEVLVELRVCIRDQEVSGSMLRSPSDGRRCGMLCKRGPYPPSPNVLFRHRSWGWDVSPWQTPQWSPLTSSLPFFPQCFLLPSLTSRTQVADNQSLSPCLSACVFLEAPHDIGVALFKICVCV